MEFNLSAEEILYVKTQVASMRFVPVVEDVEFEQFVEERILYFDGGIPRVENDYLYNQSYREEIISNIPMVNK